MFIDGIKYNDMVEVLKSTCDSFEECVCIALRIDSAISRANKGQHGGFQSSSTHGGPWPVKICNVGAVTSRPLSEQKKRDIENVTCFRCHKTGCCP